MEQIGLCSIKHNATKNNKNNTQMSLFRAADCYPECLRMFPFPGAVCAVRVQTAAVRWGWSFVCSSVLGASSPLTGGLTIHSIDSLTGRIISLWRDGHVCPLVFRQKWWDDSYDWPDLGTRRSSRSLNVLHSDTQDHKTLIQEFTIF